MSDDGTLQLIRIESNADGSKTFLLRDAYSPERESRLYRFRMGRKDRAADLQHELSLLADPDTNGDVIRYALQSREGRGYNSHGETNGDPFQLNA